MALKATIGIAICTMDRPDDLAETLAAVAKQSRSADEIVVVDASQTCQVPAETYGHLIPGVAMRVIASTPGLSRQRNTAIDNSTSDILLFLDDDCTMHEDYLLELENGLRQPSCRTVGGGMGRLVSPDDHTLKLRFARAYDRLFWLAGASGKGRLQPSGLATYPFWSNPASTRPVDVLTGAQMAFHRDVLQRFRFDESLVTYAMEDLDFSFRVSRQYDLLYCPRALARHRLSRLARPKTRPKYRMRVLNQAYLLSKNLEPGVGRYLAMLWSQVGLVLLLAAKRDWQGVAGIAGGWHELATHRNKRRPASD